MTSVPRVGEPSPSTTVPLPAPVTEPPVSLKTETSPTSTVQSSPSSVGEPSVGDVGPTPFKQPPSRGGEGDVGHTVLDSGTPVGPLGGVLGGLTSERDGTDEGDDGVGPTDGISRRLGGSDVSETRGPTRVGSPSSIVTRRPTRVGSSSVVVRGRVPSPPRPRSSSALRGPS